MVRMIDADALAMAIVDAGQASKRYKIGDFWELRYTEIKEVMDEQPTVDAVPVRHGKWIIRDNPGTGWYRVTCSECGEDVTSTAPCIGFFPNAKVVWDYCPYCGARMVEDE